MRVVAVCYYSYLLAEVINPEGRLCCNLPSGSCYSYDRVDVELVV